jgi:hypothetical protein
MLTSPEFQQGEKSTAMPAVHPAIIIEIADGEETYFK